MRLLYLILLVFNCYGVNSQDMSGIWRGKLTQEAGGCYPEYFIELQISDVGRTIAGISYDYYDTTEYIKLGFDGSINPSTRRMVITENGVIEHSIPKDCIPCIKTYELYWSKKGDEEVLRGTWKGTAMGTSNGCPPGTIFLKKVSGPAFRELNNPVAKPAAPAQTKMLSRSIEVVKTLVLDTSGVKVELYDNGQIDGDTVSIFLDGELLLYKKGLNERPLAFNIPINAGKDYEVMMFAENLGSIPPNTALMVVTARKKSYELYLSSSEQKSAVVRIRYEK